MKKITKKLTCFLATFFMIMFNFVGITPSTKIAEADEIKAEDIFISEYVEGSSSNKAIEIFNGTGVDVDLSQYSLVLYSNGSEEPTNIGKLSGTIKNNSVSVFYNSSADDEIKNTANEVGGGANTAINFNGDDAIALVKGDISKENIVDVLGTIGEKEDWGKDVTLVRKSSITKGNKTYSEDEWQKFDKNDFSNLGSHTMDGIEQEIVELTSLKIPSEISVEQGKSTKINLTYEPENTTQKDVEWSSSDENIVQVDQTGQITGIQEGTAEIKVVSKENSEIFAICNVTVTKAVVPDVITIEEARKKEINDEVTVKGIVTWVDEGSSSSSPYNVYIQDDTAGIDICYYKDSGLTVLKEGDLVKVTGELKEFRGLLEISPNKLNKDSITVESSNNDLPEPKVVTIDKVEDYQGQLIKIQKVTLGAVDTEGETPISDGTNTINIYRIPPLNDIKEGDIVDVVAISSEYNSPQLRVRKAEDVTKTVIEDKELPVIEHDSIEEANLNVDLKLNAKVTDDVQVKYVNVFYKVKGETEYKSVEMTHKEDNIYEATISKEDLSTKGLQYYIEASDGKNVVTCPEDKNTPFEVVISDEDIFAPEITNITPEDNQNIGDNYKPEISAEYSDDSGINISSVKLLLDEKDVTENANVTESKITYIPDEELSEGVHEIKLEVSDNKGNKAEKSWSFTIGTVSYNLYYGQIHSHTAQGSDGIGTFEEAYTWARDKGKADFFAITDHSNWFDNDTKGSFFNEDGTENDCSFSEKWTKMHEVADEFNEPGKFVAIAGFEMTWSGSTGGWGHINTYNTKGFETRNHKNVDLKTYYSMISKLPNSISQLNHPGTTFGDFDDFGFYSKEADKVVNLIEVGNGEGEIRGSGYFPSYEYYTRALDKGWHLAPTNNQDNHKGEWITANDARVVALAPKLDRESIYDAFRNKRVYATEDKNLRINYTVNGNVMGSQIDEPEKLTFKIDVEDPDETDSIDKISIIVNGGVVATSKKFDSNTATWTFELNPQYSYYYVRVDEEDKDIAVTAPVWVGENVPVGISKVTTSQELCPVGYEVLLGAELYNNLSDTTFENVKVEFYKNEIKDENKIGESSISSIEPSKTANVEIKWTPDEAGKYNIYAKAVVNINGEEKVLLGSTSLKVLNKEDISKVVIDGGHQNQYVTGNYANKIIELSKKLIDKSCMAVINEDKLTSEDLKDAKLLIITDPQSTDYSKYNLTKSKFEQDEIEAIKEYVNNGGNVIFTSKADYKDGEGEYSNGTQLNPILEAIGSNLRLNDDEVVDDENNEGQSYRLMFDKFTSSKYGLTDNIPEGEKYSYYSGCSVILKEDADDSKVDFVVMGHDTTYAKDSDNDNDNIAVEKGNVCVLAAEELQNGSKIIVSGSTFFSDFEMSGDNENANVPITDNILNWMIPKKDAKLVSIKEVRKDEDKDGIPDNLGKTYKIEGYVTAQSEAVPPKNAFFEVIYVQDETGGITVFGVSKTPLPLGTKVRITGVVDQYQGDAELQISDEDTDLEIVDEETNIIEPKLMSTKESMLEENEGWLVKIQGKVTKMDSQNIYLDDGTGEARVYVEGYIGDGTGDDSTKGKWDSSIKVGDTVSAVGLASEDPEGHRLRVRNTSEIVKVEQEECIKVTNLTGVTNFKEGNDVKVTVRAENNLGEEKQITLIIGLYNEENKLLNYTAASQKLENGKYVDLTGYLKYVPTAKFVRAFVWDSIEGMTPISNMFEIPIE